MFYRLPVANYIHMPVNRTLTVIAIVGGTVFSPKISLAGKLDDTHKAVRQEPEREESSRSASGRDSGGHETESSDLILACLIPFVFPFCAIAMAAGNRDSESGSSPQAYFLPYPYAENHPGHLTLDRETASGDSYDESTLDSEAAAAVSATSYARVRVRLKSEYYYDLDGVHAPSLGMNLDSTSRVGFDTDWRLYLEPLPNKLDRMVMGTFHVMVRLMQHPTGEIHFGVGGRIMLDESVSGGFNGLMRVTLFPLKPLLITFDANIGNLGYALFIEGQLAIGAVYKHFEVSAAYRGTMITGQKERVFFQGPCAYFRAWF